MATGAAVIVTGIGVVYGIVAPGVTGPLFKPRDVETIAGRLLDLATVTGRRRLVVAVEQRVRLEFDSARIWERWSSVLHAISGGADPR